MAQPQPHEVGTTNIAPRHPVDEAAHQTRMAQANESDRQKAEYHANKSANQAANQGGADANC